MKPIIVNKPRPATIPEPPAVVFVTVGVVVVGVVVVGVVVVGVFTSNPEPPLAAAAAAASAAA